jgi:undecaprenyl-diphosphatase
MIVRHGSKSIWWLLFFFLAPALGDLISSGLIKNSLFRIRPCNDTFLQARFLLSYKPQSSSFTSSHATNHFAIATFTFYSLSVYPRFWRSLMFVWATLICYAQVYVGAHYPLDVLAGGLIGCLIGFLLYQIHKRVSNLSN